MMLARTALRLAAVGALEGAKGARPTIAGKRVFDSRIGEIDFGNPTDCLPIIIVTTDGDEGTPVDMKDGVSNRGGPPFWRNVDLTIEISMVALPEDGADFQIDEYWARRLRDGDALDADPRSPAPDAASAEPPKPAPAAKAAPSPTKEP